MTIRKRYKIVLNVEIDDPDKPHGGGGDYTNLNRLQGYLHYLGWDIRGHTWVHATIDKVVDKGEIKQEKES